MKRTNLRIGCLLLVLVLLLSVLPVTALADDEYENVDLYASYDGVIETTSFASDKVLKGTNLLSYLNTKYTDNMLTKNGYTYDIWYKKDAPSWKFDDSTTVEGWTNVLVKYTSSPDPVTPPEVNNTPSVITTDIGEKHFVVGYPVEFSFSTIANGDNGKMVIGTSNFSDSDAIEKLEYYEVQNGTWYELNGNFGPAEGFQMSDATSKFRVTFNRAGTYSFTASMVEVSTGLTLCSVDVKFTVEEPYHPSYQLDARFPSAVEVGKYQDVSVSLSGVKGCENYENVKLAVEVSKPNYSDAELWYLTDWGWPWNYDVVELGYIVNDLDLYQTTVATYPLSLHVDREGWYTFTFKLLTTDGTVLSEETATLYASYPAHDDYRIYLDSGKHGSISTRPSTWADYKDTVTVYVTPDKGYELDTLKVYDARGNRVSLYTDYHGNYYFTMPNREVTVYATFREIGHFTDVPKDSWYYDAVYYVYNHDIMDGIGNRTFNPYGDLSRAMIVTTLYRLEGEPTVRTSGSFRDVPANTWYSDAVEWAAKEGIVKGYGKKTFGPGNSVTVEQLAAILQRYADYKGYDVSDVVWLYADAVVSDWAVNNVRWAAAEGLLRDGRSTNATKVATRAEIAYALYGFMVNVAK